MDYFTVSDSLVKDDGVVVGLHDHGISLVATLARANAEAYNDE
jgi:hypothetical protein